MRVFIALGFAVALVAQFPPAQPRPSVNPTARVSLTSVQPTISGISVAVDTNAVVVSYNVSPDSYCWVRYGVAHGTYLWTSTTFSSSYTPGFCSATISGLKDGATYYFLPTARPNADDEANICAASSCGAVEQIVSMPDASVSHLPAAPASVAANLLSEPDTTGYSIVNLVDGGAVVNHECVSAENVTAPAGYSWTITAGETLTAIISGHAMTYGTVFQVPQGTTCIVQPSYVPSGRGYDIPALPVDPLATSGSIDALNHRWIIFRTAPGGVADFPPFGTRTGPTFFNHYGGFKANVPCTLGYGTLDGAIFHISNSGVHHYWFENLTFSVDDTQPMSVWGSFLQFGNGEGGGLPPFPKYMVMRANYFHGPARVNVQDGFPTMKGGVVGTMAGEVAIAGNYFDNLYQSGTTSGGFFFGIYFLDCGDTGVCNTGGPVLIDNNYMHGMAMNVYVESNNPTNPTAAHDFTVTHNYLYWPYDPTYAYAAALGGYGCRNQIEFKDMQRALVNGNYINGQWACADTGPAILMLGINILTDVTISSNYITKSASVFALSGEGSQTVATSRQSNSNRMLVTNNLAYDLGRGNYNAGGGGIGTQVASIGTPVTNLAISNNTIIGPLTDAGYYYPWVIDFGGGGNGQMTGFTFENNIAPFGVASYGTSPVLVGSGIFSQSALAGPGVLSHPATPQPIDSLSWSPLNFTNALASFSGYADATPGLGMQGASIISGGTGYPNTGNLIFTNCLTPPAGTFSATNGVITATTFSSFGAGCNPATMTVTADTHGGGIGASLRPAYGLTPAYSWTGNIMTCTDLLGADLSMSECSTFSSTMPAGDVYAAGNTTADRLAAAGVTSDYSITPTTINPGTIGADLNTIYSDTGTVTGVSVEAGVTTATISYTAPDDRACSVDTSLDGTTWTRVTDRGGSLAPGLRRSRLHRALKIEGLSAGTVYQYRVLCYAEQLSPLFSGDQITDGTFSTFAQGVAGPGL